MGLVRGSSSLGPRAHVVSDCDDRQKDSNLGLGGQAIVWDVVFYDMVVLFQHPLFVRERTDI